MKRIAAPRLGALSLPLYPAVYAVWKEAALSKEPDELSGNEILTTSYLASG